MRYLFRQDISDDLCRKPLIISPIRLQYAIDLPEPEQLEFHLNYYLLN